MGVDPQDFDEANLHSFNRYAYGNNNPYKFKDPNGEVAETILDVVSLGLSIAAFKSDPTLLNGLALAYDAVAAATPFLPGGAGILRQAGRAADAVGDAARAERAIVTSSKTRHEALNKAKEANDIPRSASPDHVYRPGTDRGKEMGLDERNVRLYEYTNSRGEKIWIREDKAVRYGENGRGNQPAHFNAGPAGEKLRQHHGFGND
jgi:HNH/endonuclease VII toxin of polymorphic toxin system component